ncbi:Heparan-alpha-glucosaminide N-acetyltransferase [Orchesella cincta]|uniref:Heparan-alpha-glucosaminide N-acetyltransferase n=1 Tax=Orchesella cincta TaxID=48709 RepID=A0A1D2MH20_ORCCI|nr:Heparan-alpha-glucosaminide N-acetyltransferase [Orchesella cincta]
MSWIEDPGLTTFGGFNISELEIDQAWVNVSTTIADTALWLYEVSTNCHRCPFQRIEEIKLGQINKYAVSTKFPTKYRIRSKGNDAYIPEFDVDDRWRVCDIQYNFEEFGVYSLNIGGNVKEPNCSVKVELEPVNIYLPLLLAFLFYFVLGSIIFIISTNHARLKSLFGSSKSSSKSSKSSSLGSTVETNVGSATTDPVISPPIITNGLNRRQSSFAGSITTLNQNGNGHYMSHPYGIPPHSPPVTEVSISSKSISSTPTSTVGIQQSSQLVTGSCKETEKIESHSPSTISSNPVISGPYNVLHNNTAIPQQPQCHIQQQPLQAQTSLQQQPQQQSRQQRTRLRSLDTFRGICIVIMIFVNDGGAGYYFFDHATWDGLYVADLVFPWFLWIMGVCIPVSVKSQVKRGTSRLQICRKIFIRSLKLIGIGIVLGSLWGPVNVQTMRIPGVLQRFGVCYFVCSALVLLCMTVNFTKPETSKLRAALQDVEIIWISWVFILLLVLVHSILTFFLPVPGCPTGYLGPGGLADGNLYSGIYAYDPEGTLGTLTSIVQVWLGVQTGVTMLVYPRASSRLKRWGVWAVTTGICGAILCGFSQTGGWIPLNKNLWSLSFVLVTNSFALILLSALYFVIDIKKWWSGAPFFEPGMNSILLYVAHQVAHALLPWHYVFGPMRTHFTKLVECLWGTSLWVLISVYLYQKKIFWTL